MSRTRLLTDAQCFWRLTRAVDDANRWVARRTLVALDVGSVFTGVAVSDDTQAHAVPLFAAEAGDRRLAGLMAEACGIVCGMPYGLAGTSTWHTGRTLATIRRLTRNVGKPVLLWDERFTTQYGHAMVDRTRARMARGLDKDAQAAACILEEYLCVAGTFARPKTSV